MDQTQLDAFAIVCERSYKGDHQAIRLMAGPDGKLHYCQRTDDTVGDSWLFTEFKPNEVKVGNL